MFTYLTWLLQALISIHGGATLAAKLKGAWKLAFLVSPFGVAFHDLDKWRLDNVDYVNFVFGAIIIDHTFGTIKHTFYDRDFDFKENIKGLLIKISMVLAGGYLFEGINTIINGDSMLAGYLEIVTQLMVFLYPAGSAFGNMSIITGGQFPPASWITRINDFKRNLNPSDLTNNDHNSPNPPMQ